MQVGQKGREEGRDTHTKIDLYQSHENRIELSRGKEVEPVHIVARWTEILIENVLFHLEWLELLSQKRVVKIYSPPLRRARATLTKELQVFYRGGLFLLVLLFLT